MVKLFLLILLSFQVSARTSDDNLTQAEAAHRKGQVNSVKYDVYLEVDKGNNTIHGKTDIQIELSHLKDALTIDFNGKINSLKVNGKKLKKYVLRKGNFDIPKTALTKTLTVEIDYLSEASHESKGIRRMKDPLDGEEYIFTDFEPYYAHRLFPCLDQPDLKAIFQFTVKAPEDWKVVHNELPLTESSEGKFKTTKFNPTPILSTYLVFFGAGPYAEWKDQFGKTPLYIHSRKSMAKFVDTDNLFNTFKKGLKFYAEYFDYPYPYSKYGQIFVPDLQMNAVESAGAVTFHEMYLFFDSPSESRKNHRDNIILHEIAHMWFGNLVTMNWWNDLWLKEGFATYLSGVAQTRELKTEYGNMDMLNSKNWSYWQDQMPATTHSVESSIPDVRSSRGIFDGITYAKGAASLKQLHFFVGEEGFKKGIRSYFKKFALKNANRDDFIQSIAEASGKDLKTWANKWLQTAGVNKIHIEFECAKNKITSVNIHQKKSSTGALYPHRTLFGLYKPGKSDLTHITSFDVTYDNELKYSEELNGKECPQFILPNQNDEDYGLFSLDKKSVRQAAVALTKLPDPLSRLQVWLILMQMVKDSELSPKQFMEFAMEAFKFEKDANLLSFIFTRYLNVRDFRLIWTYYLTVTERAALAPALEKILWQRVLTSEPGSSIQGHFFDAYIVLGQSKEALEKINELNANQGIPKGIDIDPERRWKLYRTLATNGYPGSLQLVENGLKNDPSMFARSLGMASKASYPDLDMKKDLFKKFFEPTGDITYNELSQIAQNFNNPNYPELNKKFVEEYFSRLTAMKWDTMDNQAQLIFVLFPASLCTKDVEKLSEKSLKKVKNLTNLARKYWLEAHDDLSKCVRVRSKKW